MAEGCARRGCRNAGTHHPVLLLSPAAHATYEGPPAEAQLGILVCTQHQADTQAADLISDEGWAVIVGTFAAVGRAEPDRATVGLVWRRPGAPGHIAQP